MFNIMKPRIIKAKLYSLWFFREMACIKLTCHEVYKIVIKHLCEKWRKNLFFSVLCDMCLVIIFATLHLCLHQINVNTNSEYKYKMSPWKIFIFASHLIYLFVSVVISKNIRHSLNHHLWTGESVVRIRLCWFVLSEFLNAVFWLILICGEPVIFP
jgi:hypothetical protein